jgi:hypothetical protein
MKFKSFIDSDIEDFRKLNIGIVDDSKDELVRKMVEKYGIKNKTIELIDDINILLGRNKNANVGFTLAESGKIERKIKRLNKRKLEALKIKLFESNSFLSEMKRQLEEKLKQDLGE